jgi:hypothetical protein
MSCRHRLIQFGWCTHLLKSSILEEVLQAPNMPKKSKASKDIVQLSHKFAVSPALTFPDISQKEALECRVLLEDQIILIEVRFISV